MKAQFLIPAAMLLMAASAQAVTVTPADIIPRPASVTQTKGEFSLTAVPLTYAVKGDAHGGLKAYMETLPELFTPAAKPSKALIYIAVTGGEGESYTMDVTPRQIKIKAPTAAGAFYGLQSLIQLAGIKDATAIECGKVADEPRFAHRGLLFDVSRHFRSPEFLKKQIDAMALMKLNNLHLHFTDAAGWRMQIDRYPRLTEFAAWRPQAVWQDWVDNGSQYCDESDPRAKGGYYTKEQLRDLVKYAADRHIRIIPEIEIPGHSKEVTTAYPELSCSGKPYVDEDLCIGKEATFDFLEDVLTEVMDVFPSEYIHIGGDEASKAGWRNCKDCQARMKAEGLKDVDELQSYAIERVEKFVNSKGRSIIGWDEILEGGLAPNATVMSWRGTEGGIKALKSGHDVIMTPGEFCYIDYTQDAPFREPISIGGYTPLSKVYSYEPLEPGLTDDDARHLMGLQANLWSEYVPSDEHAEYMYYPRAYAIAEIGWATPEKNYDDFHRRALMLNDRLTSEGYHAFDLANEYGQRRESLTEVDHAARGAKVTYTIPYSDKYKARMDSTLVDGVRGGWTYGSDNRWQGFAGDFDATVDLGSVRQLHSAGISFMHAPGAWVHLPQFVEFEVSDNGRDFKTVETVWTDLDPVYGKILMKNYVVTPAPGTQGRYVRIKAKGHDRPGAWLFADEIIVN